MQHFFSNNHPKTARAGFVDTSIIIIVTIIAVFLFAVIWSLLHKASIDYADYDVNTIIEANADNGYIGDHVIGDADSAKVLIFEYADYQCSGCATSFPRIETLVEEYDGAIAAVYRSYQLSYHDNTTAAASAAEAAGLQGYWQEYAETLFSNQSSWYYASGSERTELFESFFESASSGNGNLEQFRADIASENVKLKVNFDLGLSNTVDITGTPTFFINGSKVDFTDASNEEEFLQIFRDVIDPLL